MEKIFALVLLFISFASPASAAEAPPPTLDTGNTAWMLAATALVLMMTVPALALFYGGLVRKTNALATTMQSFATCSLVAVIWVVAGYSLAFTNGHIPFLSDSTLIGDFSRFLFSNVPFDKPFILGAGLSNASPTTIPEPIYMCFQMTFAIITPALITGAFSDRIKFSAMLWFMGLWSLIVYAPIAHWVWDPNGFLFKLGILDYAGGTVVHTNAGIAGLVAALVIGRRLKRPAEGEAHNIVFSVIGASLLWVGWIGFNAGSALAADGRAAMACATTIVATAMAALAWMGTEWMVRGRPSVSGKITGAVAGLVAITPASGFVDITGALAIGLAAGVICYWGATKLKAFFGYDDSLDCFGVHGVGGILGAALTGVFASKAIGGTAPSLHQLVIQLTGIGVTIVWCAFATFVILKVIDMVIGLRVSPAVEEAGLDPHLHGEQIL